jgi:hypothetical protein
MNKNADEIKAMIETPEVIAQLERGALRDLLAKIERGEGEQIETRRAVGDMVTLLGEDVKQRNFLLQELKRIHFILSTKQNYLETMRANHEAKQAGEGVG